MILSEIGKRSFTKFKRINRYLEENYGFRLSKDLDKKNIYNISKKLQEEISQLKCQGISTIDSSEISKRLLMIEGLKHLLEFTMHNEKYSQHPTFQTVVKHMVDYVVDAVELGDDYEDAMRQAMKEYRSSRYRFPDDEIESSVRDGSGSHLLNNGLVI